MSAADKRARIAAARDKWLSGGASTPAFRHEADIELEGVLVDTGTIKPEDGILMIVRVGGTVCVVLESWEALDIDNQGNVLRGRV